LQQQGKKDVMAGTKPGHDRKKAAVKAAFFS